MRIELKTQEGTLIQIAASQIAMIAAPRRDKDAPGCEIMIAGTVRVLPVEESYNDVKKLLEVKKAVPAKRKK